MMAKFNPTTMHQRQTGFTLIEISIVLFILALVLGGLLPTLSSQVEQRHLTETSSRLDEIKEALIGYAVINGRLPCPATSTSNGKESPSGGNCTYFSNTTNANDDYLPAVTLGLSGTNSSGLLEDAWGNPIRYAVASSNSTSPAFSNVFTTQGGMSSVGISNLTDTNLSPDLLVCSAASGSNSSCTVGSTLSSYAVAVIYSTGKNGGSGGTSADEAENLNPNATDNHGNVFVSHDITNTFDDLVTWLSPNVLVNRMVSAGKLP